MSKFIRLILFYIIIIAQGFGQLNTEWWKYESDHFSVYFPGGLDWEAYQLITNLEIYQSAVVESQENNPKKTTYILEEGGLSSSAWFNPAESVIHQYVSQSSSDFLGSFTTNQLRSTGLHELTHASHINSSDGIAKMAVSIFGPFLQPNSFLPDWIVEGIAVSTESSIFDKEGMLNSGWSEAMVATQAKNDILPPINELTHSPNSYFSHNDEYYIGGSFIHYLTDTFGENTKRELITEIGKYWWAPILGTTLPGFVVDRSMKKIYGADSDELYDTWTNLMKEKYSEWKWEGERITFDGWYKKYVTVWENNIYYMKMVYSENDVPFFRLVEFNPLIKKERMICELKQWINSPIRIVNEIIYFSTSESVKGYANTTNNSYGTKSVLNKLDIQTGKDDEVLTDNFRSFCIRHDDEIIYSKDIRNGFGSQLWSFKNNKSQYLGEIPVQISELIVVGERIYLSGKYLNSYFNIYELNTNNITVTEITNNNWTETEFSTHNEILIYTANYDKKVALYGYDTIEGNYYQLTTTGFSRRGVVVDSSLYFISLSELGEDLYIKNFEIFPTDIPETKVDLNQNYLPSIAMEKVDYSIYKKLFTPYVRTPYFNQITMESGILFKGTDVLYHFRYLSLLNYSTEDKSVSMTTGMSVHKWAPLYLRGYTDYTDVLSLTGSYPLIVTSKPGSASVSLSGNTYFGGTKFDDRVFTPGMIIYYSFPLRSVLISVGLPLYYSASEPKNSQGLSFRISSIKRNVYGYFRLDTRFQWRSQNKISFTTRGTGNIKSFYGVGFSPSYTFQLLKLRKGFWKVNLFFEDINGRIFMDYLTAEQGKYLAAVGGEAFLETCLSMGFLRFSPVAGAVLSQNGKWNYYVRLNFPIIR